MNKSVTIIDAAEQGIKLSLQELWKFRELIIILAIRDIKVRYKQTALGIAWSVIQPVFMMVIFTLLFGRLANIPSDGVPYPVFVFSGLLMWNFFSTAMGNCSNSLVGSSAMISKIYFPRMVIPLSSIGVTLVDFFISIGVLIILMIIYEIALTWQILLVPVFAIGMFISVLGMGLWLSAISVTYRDFRYIVPFMLQIWMYVTPVIYPPSFIPENIRWLIYLNPVTGWVSGSRSAFLGIPVDWYAVGSSILISTVLFIIGLKFFIRAQQRFADVI